MILPPDLKNQKTAVFGLGATGLATAEALAAAGAQVFTWDENAAAREKAKNTRYDPTHPKNWPWAELQFLALSPGVPLTHPKPHAIVRKAKAAKVRIVGDTELFAMAVNELPARERPQVITITGSNGKSTTAALIAHILKDTGRDVALGGNIGAPILSLDPIEKQRTYVLELSSFQLDLTESLRANAAILLNITPDHLDRHGDMDGYAAAKERIFRNQTGEDLAILGVDDVYSQGICAKISAGGPSSERARVCPISVEGALGHGVYVLGGRLYYDFGDKSGEAGSVDHIASLQGAHNWQNIAAALAATSAVGVAPSVAIKSMERFEGLAHRMEKITQIGDVAYINDSKATNAEAAAAALGAFEEIFWIAGGAVKKGGVELLKPLMDRVRGAYLIGDGAAEIEASLAGLAPCVQSGNLAAAVARASRDAQQSGLKSPVVLLSPACASYDQFANFEDRGDTFRRLVLDIAAAQDDDAPNGDPRGANGAAA